MSLAVSELASIVPVVAAAEACADADEVVVVVAVVVVVVLPVAHAPTPVPGFLMGRLMLACGTFVRQLGANEVDGPFRDGMMQNIEY